MRDLTNKWYSPFRAIVVDVDDPMQLDRIKARVPEVLGNVVTDWIWPKHSSPHWSWKPAVDERVWVEFENGDIDRPLYSGTWYPREADKSSLPAEVLADYARVRMIATPGGHKIVFTDPDPEDGSKFSGITVTSKDGHSIQLSDPDPDDASKPNGITIASVTGHTIAIKDENGGSGISIESAGGHKIDMDDEGTVLLIEHSDGTTKINIDASGNVQITANGKISLLGNGGAGLTGGVVCAGIASHVCAFTGGPHPAGSSGVEGNQ